MAANVITALNLRIGFNVSEFETAQRTIRQSVSRSQQILKSMEGPMEKFANDIAAVTAAAEEEKWSHKQLEEVLDFLAKKYDVTGQYAHQTAKAQEELAAVANKVAEEEKKAAKSADDLAKAMAKQERAINAAYLKSELQKIDEEENKVRRSAEELNKALAKQEKAINAAYLKAELQKIDEEENRVKKSAEDLNKALAKQERAINAAYLKSELQKIDDEERRVKKSAEELTRALAKQERALNAAYLAAELKKIDDAEKRSIDQLNKSRQISSKFMQKSVSNVQLFKEAEQALIQVRKTGEISAAQYAKAMSLVRQEYIIAPMEAKRLEQAEARLNAQRDAAAAKAAAIANAQTVLGDRLKAQITPTQQLWQAEQALILLRKEGEISGARAKKILSDLRQELIVMPMEVKRLADEERKRLEVLEKLDAAQKKLASDMQLVSKYVKSGASAIQEQAQKEAALKRLRAAGQLTVSQYARAMKELNYEYKIQPMEAKRAADAVRRKKEADEKADKAAQKLKADVAALAEQYAKEQRKLDLLNQARANATKEIKKETVASESLSGTIRNLVGAYAGFSMLRAGVKIASDMEQAKIAFEVMAGSAEEGKRVLTEVRDFAARTPITFEGAQRSAKTLMQFGVESDRVSKTLKMLGDVAAGDTQRLEHLSLAFGQVVAAGRLTGQETLQMVNSGFNPLKQIAEDMAKEFGGLADNYFPMLKKQMEQGNISAEMVAQAIESATSAGGRFAGMTDKMGETAGGAYNQLVGAAQNLADTLGEYLLPVITDLLKSMTSIVQVINETIKMMDSSAMASLAAAAGMVAILGAVYKVIQITKLLRTATIALNVVLVIRNALSGPAGWAILAGAAVAATAGIIAMKKASEETAEELKKEEEAVKTGAAASEEYKKSMLGLTQATSAADSPIAKITSELQKQMNQLTMTEEQFRAYELTQEGLNAAEIQNVLQMERRIKALRESKDIQEMYVDRAKEQVQTEQQINNALRTNLLTRKEAATKLLALEDKRLEKIKELADAGKSIQEKYNPVAKVAEQLAQLNTLLATGNITQEQFFRERNKMLFDNIKKLDMTQPEAMEAGSAQAAQFMQKMVVDEAQQQIAELQAQTLLQQASLQAQQETNRRLAELKPVQLIRS